jgi:hypothetical protein
MHSLLPKEEKGEKKWTKKMDELHSSCFYNKFISFRFLRCTWNLEKEEKEMTEKKWRVHVLFAKNYPS